jgi:hypothetical protein
MYHKGDDDVLVSIGPSTEGFTPGTSRCHELQFASTISLEIYTMPGRSELMAEEFNSLFPPASR